MIALGKQCNQDVEHYECVLHLMEEEVRNHLYDADKHVVRCYTDEVNLATQVWMVLSSTFTEEENHAIMQEAMHLFVSGWKEEAISLMKSYCGKMIDLGGDTFFEAFDPNLPDYSPYGSTMINSYCHAWS